jgi:hypothetical protein
MKTEAELFKYFTDAAQKLGVVKVELPYLHHRINEFARNWGNELKKEEKKRRTPFQVMMHTDGVFLEHTLIEHGLAEETPNFRSDCCVLNMRIDCKMIASKYFSISERSKNTLGQSVDLKEVSHFVFWQFHKTQNRPLEYGDKVGFRILQVAPISYVFSKLKDSIYVRDSQYYQIEHGKVKYERITESA